MWPMRTGSSIRRICCGPPSAAFLFLQPLRSGHGRGARCLSWRYAARSGGAERTATLCTNAHGFSLHAGVRCARRSTPGARAPVCRWIARPAIANERVSVNRAGQVVLSGLKTPYRDGMSHLVMPLTNRLWICPPHAPKAVGQGPLPEERPRAEDDYQIHPTRRAGLVVALRRRRPASVQGYRGLTGSAA